MQKKELLANMRSSCSDLHHQTKCSQTKSDILRNSYLDQSKSFSKRDLITKHSEGLGNLILNKFSRTLTERSQMSTFSSSVKFNDMFYKKVKRKLFLLKLKL